MADSKDELAIENEELGDEVTRLRAGFVEIQRVFLTLDDQYELQKGYFPLLRYGALKTMIKNTVTEENMNKARSLTENQASLTENPDSPQSTRKHKAGALDKLKNLAADFKDLTGFTDYGPEDIRNLDRGDIRKDNERTIRLIETFNKVGLRVYNKLDRLRRRYQECKGHLPHRRYTEMKDMIKQVINDESLQKDLSVRKEKKG